jgi:uncharacterized protein YjbI with pentapeptide repeats
LFAGADLSDSKFDHSILRGADFSGDDESGPDSFTLLNGATFRGCDLTDAKLETVR